MLDQIVCGRMCPIRSSFALRGPGAGLGHQLWHSLLRDETGATAVEYALLTALIALGVFQMMHSVGQCEIESFGAVSVALSQTPDNPAPAGPGLPATPHNLPAHPGIPLPGGPIMPSPVHPSGPISTPGSQPIGGA